MNPSSDAFLTLRVPRRLWLDPEELKSRYFALSSESHPDRVHELSDQARREAETRTAELNAAYNSLRSPRERILHLLELSGQAKPDHVQTVPVAALNFFAPVAELTRAVDSFLAEKRGATSPMMKASFFQKSLDWTDKIQNLQSRLAAEITLAETQISEMDRVFDQSGESLQQVPASSIPVLTELAATLGFLEKWQSQLRERLSFIAF